MNDYLDTPVEFLKGVGPVRAGHLREELDIKTFGDLLTHYPFRYVDRSRFYTVSEANADLAYIQLKGKIIDISLAGKPRAQRLMARFKDETGMMDLVWFQGVRWIKDIIKTNTEYVIFGKPTEFNGRINIVHPEVEPVTENNTTGGLGFQPLYNSTEKLKAKSLDSRGLQKIIKTLINNLPRTINETIPQSILQEYSLNNRYDALVSIHQPENNNQLAKAQFRLKFEEFFYVQTDLLIQKLVRLEKVNGRKSSQIGDYFNRFYHEKLPFDLTNAQKKVMKEIRGDMGSGLQMNRMLQGDVGSGKTLVALMSMLIALDNQTQACLMAPTEILARQHFTTLSELIEGLGINVALLTGNTKTVERRSILERSENGEIHILVGTHALIEDVVKFKELGLAVIDEQHRFGVEQRSRLWSKSEKVPHVLVMTATPIPRTLAMTIYGDLDTSIIDELPPGRKPVQTVHRFEGARLQVFEFLRNETAKGRQVYIVYPLIEESETLDYNNLMEGFDAIERSFPKPKYQISIVHGKQKPADKDFEMQRFVKGETQIMVATTVIEVGVNVPNASLMLIESAERFGLSQLHQLRGRVGRGAEQSYCILMTSHKLTSDARLRMETMVRTNDGFEIAEIDLKLRGPGDIMGTQQSGILNFKIADLAKDAQILSLARNAADKMLKEDPFLEWPQNKVVNRQMEKNKKDKKDFSRIS
ncbi:MAG: ATP-dependent DNA helicase RecG [Bacteroidia bacterium]